MKDDDGYVAIRDRSKDLIISGGENVSSLSVEAALMEHDAVALCAVDAARSHVVETGLVGACRTTSTAPRAVTTSQKHD